MTKRSIFNKAICIFAAVVLYVGIGFASNVLFNAILQPVTRAEAASFLFNVFTSTLMIIYIKKICRDR